MKRLVVFVATILLCICVNNGLSDDSPYMQMVIDGSITVIGDPEIIPELTIIFTFTLKPEGPFYQHMKMLEEQFAEKGRKGDSAAAEAAKEWAERIDQAYLLPDTNIEYVTDRSWRGQLKPLQEYSLTAKVRLRHRMPTQITGVVKTYCGTAAYGSRCMTANFFASDTLYRGVEIPKPAPPKPDTLWKDGHPIIIQTIYKPVIQVDTIPPVEKIEGPVPPHRQPEKKTISVTPSQRGLGAMKETAGSYLVTGRFFNVYIPHDTTPAAHMRYYVAYELYGSWYFDFELTTDADGAFAFYTANSHIAVLEISGNEAATVCWTESHTLEEGATLWPYEFGVVISNPSYYDVDIPISYTTNSTYPAPYHIAQAIRSGYWEFYSKTGLVQDPVWVYWDSLNTQYSGSFCGRYIVAGLPLIFINNRNGDDHNWDEWDECVIIHEYVHFLMYYYTEWSPYAFGQHNLIVPPNHDSSGGIHNRIPDLVFNESLADVVQAILNGTPVCRDSIYEDTIILTNHELPLPDAPYVNRYEGPSHLTPYFNGAQVEGAVLASLWDLYDASDDDNYYQGSVLYGHNNDHNGGLSWSGFSAIWDVLYWYDPFPDSTNHNHPWNIYEFIDGWRLSGYPFNETFSNIFEAHNIGVFIPGDVDGNGKVNIGDGVIIITYVFRGGPPPDPFESGDLNCDNLVSIGDAVFIVNYLFRGGPEPVMCPDYRLN
ncbi:MAG: hypothetical protein GYA46_13545 [candidate division Zixibacteria bacterium]|nr:hypothetical protein [candidate division Zixibacteria bacterium]